MTRARFVRSLLDRLVTVVVIVSALTITLGFFGATIHAFDSLGHFRVHVAVLAAGMSVVLLLRRQWVAAAFGLVAGAIGLWTTTPILVAKGSGTAVAQDEPSYSLLQMNLRFNARDKAEAVRRIADTMPDIVTVQEVTHDWQAVFDTIAGSYPYQAFCGSGSDGATGILSRRPFVAAGEDICRPRDGLIVRSVDFNGRAVAVASLHLDWPWPHKQWKQIERLTTVLPTLAQPSLLAGDFNAAPWSAAVAAVAAAGGWQIQSGIGPSWMSFGLPFLPAAWAGLPIDNLLVSPQIDVASVATLAQTSSDHLPVFARFVLERPEGAPPVVVASRRRGAD